MWAGAAAAGAAAKGAAGACKPKLQELKHNFEKLSGFKLKSMWAGATATKATAKGATGVSSSSRTSKLPWSNSFSPNAYSLTLSHSSGAFRFQLLRSEI